MNETTRGRRADLELAPVAGAENLIADLVLPGFPVKNKTGREYYRALVSKGTATTDRAVGGSLTTSYLSGTYLDWSTQKAEQRFGIPLDEVENYGGIEVADAAGGEGAKLSVLEAIENAVASAVLTGSTTPVTAGNFLVKVRAAKESVKRYAGQTALVLSQECYDSVMTQPDVLARMRRFSAVTPADNEQILALRKNLLAMVCEVDLILIGDDEYWAATVSGTDLGERCAIVKIAPPDQFSHQRRPVWAKMANYYPGDGTRFEVKSFVDDDASANKYDAAAHFKIMIFNSGARVVLSGITKQATFEADGGAFPVEVVNTSTNPVFTSGSVTVSNTTTNPVPTQTVAAGE